MKAIWASRSGLQVITKDGRALDIVSIIETDRKQDVHNLTVQGIHTYFVGKQRVLVHNCEVKISKQKQAAHTPGTTENKRRKAKGRYTSTFNNAEDGEALTKSTVKNGKVSNEHPTGGVTRTHDTGRVTGTDGHGHEVTGVMTHTDNKGYSHGHPCSTAECK